MKNTRSLLFSAICLCYFTSCSSDDGPEYTTLCGVVVDTELRNPVQEDDGDEVTIRAASDPHLVVVSLNDEDDERILVKIAGLDGDVEEAQRQKAISYIQRLNPQARFYRSEKNCVEKVSGGDAIPGSIITEDGENIGEELLLRGLASVNSQGKCKTGVLENCYLALLVEGS